MKSEVKNGGWNESKIKIEDRLADPSDKIPAIVTDTFGLDGLPGGGYVFAPIDIVPLGSHSYLVVSGLEGAATPIDPTALALLSCCTRFAPIEGHAETIRRQFPAIATQSTQVIQQFINAGLLLSWKDLQSRRRLSRAARANTIHNLVIPTANRPDEVIRAITSYTSHLREHNHECKVSVSDDSRSRGPAIAIETAVQRLRRTTYPSVHLYKRRDRFRFIDALSKRHSIPDHVLRFGLLGARSELPSMGANRNYFLLMTAGEMLLTVDDDTVCQPGTPIVHSADNRVYFGAEGDPTEFWFFRDRSAVRDGVKRIDIDVMAEHGDVLGWDVSELAMQAPPRTADLTSACRHLLNSIWSGSGRVRVTLNGSSGDSGMYSGRNVPLLRNAGTRERLLKDRITYEAAIAGREVIRQATRTTICHAGPLMSMFMGLDNTTLLPPFFPVARGEDTLFGIVLAFCFAEAYIAYLPWSLSHEAVPGRTYVFDAAGSVRICDVVLALVESWAESSRLPLSLPERRNRRRCREAAAGPRNVSSASFWNCCAAPIWNRLPENTGSRQPL